MTAVQTARILRMLCRSVYPRAKLVSAASPPHWCAIRYLLGACCASPRGRAEVDQRLVFPVVRPCRSDSTYTSEMVPEPIRRVVPPPPVCPVNPGSRLTTRLSAEVRRK